MADVKDDVAWGQCVADTPIGWFQERMKLSGITRAVATASGLRLIVDQEGAHVRIPYFTIDAVETTHWRQRNREESVVYEKGISGGNFRGKYTQPKRSKNTLYWPPLVGGQRMEYGNPGLPLIVCEGEFKALAAKMACLGSGIEALVCGVPGTALCPNVREAIEHIPCTLRIDDRNVHRTVFIAMDWNGKGQSKERSLSMEYDLKQEFEKIGAKCVVLRWPIDEDNNKEQKLDDWLVAGGDLSEAMEESKKAEDKIVTEVRELWDYCNRSYALMDGVYIPLRAPDKRWTRAVFGTMEEAKFLTVGKKRMPLAEVWGFQPPEDRNIVDDIGYIPPPLGQAPDRYVYRSGKRLLNSAPDGWVCEPWAPDVIDATPFVDLCTRLCQEHAPWFIQWLASIAQQPLKRGSHIVIFRDSGGTGKSAMFKTLDSVFGPYSGMVDFAGNFNSILENKLIAWASDMVAHGANDKDLETKLKNFSGESTLLIKRKYVAEYTIDNYARLMIATNKDWIVPFGPEERRYVVFGGLAPWDPQDWAKYHFWLQSGGIDQIRWFLLTHSLEGFDVNLPGPRTDQREHMERLSAAPFGQILNDPDGAFSARDVWTNAQLLANWNAQEGVRKLNATTLGIQLVKFGAQRHTVKVDGKTEKLWVLRNFDKYPNPQAMASEFKFGGSKF